VQIIAMTSVYIMNLRI